MREDWIEEQLGKLFFTTSGSTPSRKNASYYTGVIPWVKSGELDKGLILDTEEKITEEAISNSSAKKFPPETLLIALYGATIGKLAFLGIEAATNQAICGIFKNQYCESKYLYNFLFFKRPRLISQGTGGAQPNISQTILKKLNVPICSIPEQRAIVAKIEELFSDLDKGITDLKKAQDQLKVYRQAVLKKAFEGELTKEWREQNKFTKNDWKFPPLGEVLIQSKEKHKPDNIENLFYVGLEHIEKETGNLTETVGVSKIKTVKNKFKAGQILYGKLRPYLNKVYLAKELGVCSTDILVFNLEDSIIGKFAVRFMLSRQFVNDMSANTNGINLPRVSTKYINNYKFPLPPTKEQHQIVQEIESRLSVCDKVEESITESLEKAKALRQSILKKAFEGTLLSQEEIAACKAAPDYEPASVLLEKIKAEKAAQQQITKPSNKRTTKTTKVQKKLSSKNTISKDIQAGVISKVIQLHEKYPEHLNKLTHVKCEKISHLAEYHLCILLGRDPLKEAAGPNDFPHLKKVEHRAKMAGFFRVIEKPLGHTYASTKNMPKVIASLEKKIGSKKTKALDHLIHQFLTFDLEQSEIVATLYAGWNNLLIEGKKPSDEEIVYESRENWSQRKLSIERARFFRALEWMRQDDIALIPQGIGKKVLAPNRKKVKND